MLYKENMTKLKSKIALIIVFAMVVTLFSMMGVSGVAYANAYGDVDTNNNWYYNSANLYIDGAKSVIQGWDLANKPELKANPVVIAVVDTGCTLVHEVFNGVLLENSEGVVAYNAYDKSNNVEDNSSDKHGTSMMGTMAMIIKDLGLQDYIKLVPVKASYTKSSTSGKSTSHTESFPLSATVEAINYSAQTLHADIINFSYGIAASQVDTKPESTTNWIKDEKLLEAIASATPKSVLIAAAGNNGANSSDDAYYIAAHEGVIGVMGYGVDMKKVDTSNFGNHYQIYAPGIEIATTSGTSGYKANGKGTSYASAITSVCAAVFELRTKVEGTSLSSLNVTRVINQYSPNYISYTYTGEGEEPIQYMQRRLDLEKLLLVDYSTIISQYEEPTGIAITQTGTQFKDVTDPDTGKDIKLATINIHEDGLVMLGAYLKPKDNIDSTLENNITWLIGDASGARKTIDSGKELLYHITQKDVLESMEQTARIQIIAQYGTFEDVWYVDFQFDAYNNNSSVKIVPGKGINKDNVAFLNKEITINIEGMEYVNKNVGIMWYINGEEYATTKEASLTFTPPESGTYTISARYLGWSTNILNEVTFTVQLNTWLIATIVICGAIGLAVIGVVIAVVIKKAMLSKKEI